MGLSEYLGLSAREVRTYGTAGLLHDLGKVRVPKSILQNPGKLSPEELAIMVRCGSLPAQGSDRSTDH